MSYRYRYPRQKFRDSCKLSRRKRRKVQAWFQECLEDMWEALCVHLPETDTPILDTFRRRGDE